MPSHIMEVSPYLSAHQEYTNPNEPIQKGRLRWPTAHNSLDLGAGVDRFRALCYNSSHHQPPLYWLAGDSCDRSETPGNSLYFFLPIRAFLGDIIDPLAANNLFSLLACQEPLLGTRPSPKGGVSRPFSGS